MGGQRQPECCNSSVEISHEIRQMATRLLCRTSSGPYESEMICEQPERSFINPNWKYFFKLAANLMTIFVHLSLCSQAIRTPSMFWVICSLNQSGYFSTHRNQSTKNVNCSFAVVFGRARSFSVVLGRVRSYSVVLQTDIFESEIHWRKETTERSLRMNTSAKT